MLHASCSARTVLLLVLGAIVVSAQGEMVIVKEGTTLYHRPGCPVVRDGVGVIAMTVGQAEARGLKSHPDCDPSRTPPAQEPASRGDAARPRPSKPAAPVFVFVDAQGKQYHRERCPRLGSGTKKIGLDAAAKSYWPCPVCKPPIRPRKR